MKKIDGNQVEFLPPGIMISDPKGRIPCDLKISKDYYLMLTLDSEFRLEHVRESYHQVVEMFLCT